MYIEEFLKRHPEIKISSNVLDLCKSGEEIMKNSIDPLHNDHHIGRLLKYLTTFLKQHKKEKINFEILLLAICWHDSWKAKKKSHNPFILIYHQIYEGIGSMLIFSKNAIEIIPKHMIAEINYAIRKHAQFQLFPLSSIESKILKDLDDLDVLSAKRLRTVLRVRYEVNQFTRIFAKYYLKMLISKKAVEKLQLKWTQRRIKRMHEIVNKIISLV